MGRVWVWSYSPFSSDLICDFGHNHLFRRKKSISVFAVFQKKKIRARIQWFGVLQCVAVCCSVFFHLKKEHDCVVGVY